MNLLNPILLFVFICIFDVFVAHGAKGNFTIDEDNETFLLNGKPFRYLAGSIHYPRVHFTQWEDRIMKAKAAGLDAISTYVMWNVHEPVKGVFNFKGQYDLTHFLELCQKHDLYVILRAGPYVCAEWEFGGFPAWLVEQNISMNLRTMSPYFIQAVDGWLSRLLPMMKPYLIQNGGPIISVQIENEYGSYDSCDHKYMKHLALIFRSLLGDEVVLFTTDGNTEKSLKCGSTTHTYATVDFGPTKDVKKAFEPMREFNKGPLVNSELYTGWLDVWGDEHHRTKTDDVVNTIEEAFKLNASVNMYMFEGGTNFGFMNGVDPGNNIQITSYDYDSPLTEAGDVTPKYMAIRKMMMKYKPNLPPIPPNSTKKAYGVLETSFIGTVVQLLPILSSGQFLDSLSPLSMEEIGHYYGFSMYRHILTRNYSSALLKLTKFADRAYILLNKKLVGILDSNLVDSLMMQGSEGQKLDIIVENTGRISYGKEMRGGRKGIFGDVMLGKEVLTNWRLFPLFLENEVIKRQIDRDWWSELRHRTNNPEWEKEVDYDEIKHSTYSPRVYLGYMNIYDTPQDTFLSMCGWSRGVVWINGFNVGRYRPKEGPQTALYIPKALLKIGVNRVLVLELEGITYKKPEVKHDDNIQESSTSDNLKFVKADVSSGEGDKLDATLNLPSETEIIGSSTRGYDLKTLMKGIKKIPPLDTEYPKVEFVDQPQIDSICF